MPAVTAERSARDLATRADVEELLRRFYGQVFVDDMLAEPFAEIRQRGLESHLPVMCDFWETALFRAGRYQGSALLPHQRIHDRHPLTAAHFLRWLTLWVPPSIRCTVAQWPTTREFRRRESPARCITG